MLMNTLYLDDVTKYVEDNIGSFHSKRLEKLEGLELIKILKRKNPYLFKAKNVLTAQDLVKGISDAFLSSQEETIFGDFLEGVAIFVCSKVYGGFKSSKEGVDLEFGKGDTWYIVEIKSGPHWANSSQIKRMRRNFDKAKKSLQNSKNKIIAINGCCYGKDRKPDKGDYYKLCGQRFWEFISDNVDLYTDIIEPLGHQSKQKNDEFNKAYAQMINRFTREFAIDYCKSNGEINWVKLVQLNSSK